MTVLMSVLYPVLCPIVRPYYNPNICTITVLVRTMSVLYPALAA